MSREKKYFIIIIILSILVPLLVAAIFLGDEPAINVGMDISFLPKVHATLNSLTTIMLLIGFYFIRNKKIKQHRICMITALFLSIAFLISYVTYHASSSPTTYGGTGAIRYIYYFILISHIILAVTIVPLALVTLYRGLFNQVAKHRKIARWTLPLWLYVTITGVIVYFMIAPYY